jgi:hypothetical protein
MVSAMPGQKITVAAFPISTRFELEPDLDSDEPHDDPVTAVEEVEPPSAVTIRPSVDLSATFAKAKVVDRNGLVYLAG